MQLWFFYIFRVTFDNCPWDSICSKIFNLLSLIVSKCMDLREGMTLPGSASYYPHNRGGISGSINPGPNPNVHTSIVNSFTTQSSGIQTTPIFKNLSNPNILVQSNVSISGGSVSGSSFHVENPSPNFPHGMGMVRVSQGSETVKKKRGRPRKYCPDGGANMSLRLSASTPSSGATSSGEKARRGRPPGTGWKQQLAPLGDWMNSSAGLAFSPHVLNIGSGEDVAAKILAFAQQRQRALCVLSANGSVSVVTLRQPTNSGGIVTYEGRFEILCLSGSYLLSESGSPQNRTGGISISVCSPDGHIIGGAIGGRLMAANPVQVVACSFVYGASKAKTKSESTTKGEKALIDQSSEKSLTPVSATPSQTLTPNSGPSVWPTISRHGAKNSIMDIDLSRG